MWHRSDPRCVALTVRVRPAICARPHRLRITDILSDLFRKIIAWTPSDLRYAVYLCTNRVRAASHPGGRAGASRR